MINSLHLFIVSFYEIKLLLKRQNMESQQSKIALYEKRSVGDKLSVTFDLIKFGWRPLLKYMTYLMLPLCILQAIFTNSLTDAMTKIDPTSMQEVMKACGGSYLGLIITAIVGVIFLSSIVYALVKCYTQSHSSLESVSKNMSSLIPLYMKKIIWLILFSIGVSLIFILICGGLLALSKYALFIIIPIIFAICVPLNLFAPIYLYEEIGLWAALIKAFRIGFPTWGGTFLLGLINTIIGGIFSVIVGLPYLTVYFVKLMQAGSGDGEPSFIFGIITFLFCVLYLFGAYLGRTLVSISMAYQYGHAAVVAGSTKNEAEAVEE